MLKRWGFFVLLSWFLWLTLNSMVSLSVLKDAFKKCIIIIIIRYKLTTLVPLVTKISTSVNPDQQNTGLHKAGIYGRDVIPKPFVSKANKQYATISWCNDRIHTVYNGWVCVTACYTIYKLILYCFKTS